MTVEHIEVLVEEASMEAALKILLPKMIAGLTFTIHAHGGKRDLLKKLPKKLKGYAAWIPETYRVLVVIDRDDQDCRKLKAALQRSATQAGLPTKNRATRNRYVVVNRLAIPELEAWYFGDWEAVRAAYSRVDARVTSRSKYRDPDCIAGGTWEAFERVLQKFGYFKTGLRKIEAARAIAEHMDPDRNTSHSFQVLRDTLRDISM
jgi:hypothetical protein